MTTAVNQGGALLTPEASAALSATLADPKWLAQLRRKAAEHAASRPMPLTIERPWKYLDVSQLDLGTYRPSVGATTIKAPEGATVGSLNEARPETAKLLGTSISLDRSKLTAIHYAFLQEVMVVDVAANTELSSPVHILRDYADDGSLATPHTLIVTGANTRVTVIDDFTSGAGDIVAIPVVEIFPGPGSEVRYITLHRWGAATRVFSEQRCIPGRDSTVISFSLAVGGRVLKSHLESSLEARGSVSELYGLCYGTDDQHVDFYTVQDHIGADTRSDLLFKAALKDRSRSVYYGLTRVGFDSTNADANQANRNLLLSKDAKADSDPVLEILTSNVIRASHGATAGPVDEEQLFYLETRGIEHADAEAMLVRGFLEEVVNRMGDEAVRAAISAALEAKLEAVA